MITDLSTAPLKEFRTLKAAKRFAARLTVPTTITPSTQSDFDMYHPVGKKLYQVFAR